ncbi:MAG TPA: InlB B-repeat-containing protein [Acidimicrobiales bacterium]|nr:InlB B-repeat-containing protein [Acidimicrobiales bacterium]
MTLSAGSGSVTPTSMQYTVGTSALVLPAPTSQGYTFSGWYSSASGGTLVAGAGGTFTPSQDTTLYAQWTPDVYTVTFNAGSGSVTPTSLTYTVGTTGISLPTPTSTGYTFSGWFTAATGGTLVGLAGASFAPAQSTTVYAQWSADSFTVTYNAGGGTVSPTSAPFTVGGTSLALPTPTFAGYTFAGWFTEATGGSLVGLGGASYAPTQSVTLYAQWTAETLTVTFDAGGGSVSPSQSTYTTGSSAIALPTPINGSSTFLGWFSAPSGGTLVGQAGASYTPTQSVTLYAQWQAPATYTVTFDANGGTGSIAPITATAGSTITLPGVSGMLRPGFTLASWSTSKGGGGVSYVGGSTMTVTTSLTLYAQWSGSPPAVVLGAVGPFKGRSTTLTAAMKAQVARLAAAIKARKFKTVTIFGYAPSVGLASMSVSISRLRASAVAAYLRQRLARLGVHVAIKSAGEGFVPGGGSANARVEVLAR